jgi:hypothetical protein
MEEQQVGIRAGNIFQSSVWAVTSRQEDGRTLTRGVYTRQGDQGEFNDTFYASDRSITPATMASLLGSWGRIIILPGRPRGQSDRHEWMQPVNDDFNGYRSNAGMPNAT